MTDQSALDSVVLSSTILSGLERGRKNLMRSSWLYATTQAQDHIEKQLSSHVEPRIVF